MAQVNSPPQISDSDHFDRLNVTAAEINPVERFNELLASFTNPNERNHQTYQQSLISLLWRYLNHLSNDERTDLLHRFGAALSQRESQEINFKSLATVVSSVEDRTTFFHFSGLAHSVLKQIQRDPSNRRHLIQLAHLSEIYPLVSTGALSEDLSSFFRSFLCTTHRYLGNTFTNQQSSLRAFAYILSNELMASSIIGCGEAVSEIIVTWFPSFSKALSLEENSRRWADTGLRLCENIIEISQNNPDPIERIVAFIIHLSSQTIFQGNENTNNRMNLLDLCIHHTATFLNSHPDLIDSFLERITSSHSLSDTTILHDRHLNLISTLSQSSSPLFAKLSEPLLDPTFPLRNVFSPRLIAHPTSSFIHIANTNPHFFRNILEKHAGHILDMAVLAAVRSVRVVSDDPSEPRCLDFGRATQNWVVLLNTMPEVQMCSPENATDFNSIPSSLLTLLVLSAASTNDDLSTAAVSVFSNQFGLSKTQTEALLFATPTTFSLSDTFTPRRPPVLGDPDHKKGPYQSICAEAGCCVMLKSRFGISFPDDHIDFARMLAVHFAGCLVNALHSTTALPHSFPFFSPELCGLSQQPSVWNDHSLPSGLAALTTLADIVISIAYRVHTYQLTQNPTDDGRRDTIFIHLFPFLGEESQTRFLSSFNTFYRSKENAIHESLDRVVECLVEMATVKSYYTPIALLTEMKQVARFLCFINPETHSIDRSPTHTSSLEQSIVEKLKTAEGEERWHLVTQLAVVSRDDPDLVKELIKAENDAQALLILSVPSIRSTPRPRFHLDKNPAAFDRLVELAGHLDNLPLVTTALAHIADTFDELKLPPLAVRMYQIKPQPELRELVFNTLLAITPLRRDGVEEGCVVGKDETTSLIVVSCMNILLGLMSVESFDTTPLIDSLVSLTVTSDLTLLRFILLVLQEIEERTQNTTTPFSISTATAPFRSSHQSSATQQPLPTILSSILLSASLDYQQTLSQRNPSPPSSQFFEGPTNNEISNLSQQTVQVLNENLSCDIAKETAETVCFILKKRRTDFSRTRTHDFSFGRTLDKIDEQTTPQQLIFAFHLIFCQDISQFIPASMFLPLAPNYTRLLKIVVPLSTDRTEIRSEQIDLSRLLNVSVSLFQSLIHTTTPSSLPTLPLSSLLSILSIALVRLDRIPSSLRHHDRFCNLFEPSQNGCNPQMKQIVHALCEEGMEDRSDLAVDSFSFIFLNKWNGANAQRPGDRTVLNPFVRRGPPMARINGPRGAVVRPVIHPPNLPPQQLIPPRGAVGRPPPQPLNNPPAPTNPRFGATFLRCLEWDKPIVSQELVELMAFNSLRWEGCLVHDLIGMMGTSFHLDQKILHCQFSLNLITSLLQWILINRLEDHLEHLSTLTPSLFLLPRHALLPSLLTLSRLQRESSKYDDFDTALSTMSNNPKRTISTAFSILPALTALFTNSKLTDTSAGTGELKK
ncbi:hypothetical protein BLNAU_1238 [Blattamonas nauphoetae]|uniref:Uncharacterized protein n=1 Tax=Blattamonas nauphoetae TaxID=2049346 RepID=A0ABQ9YIV6_9EUKA|nr:hypothetical protein BLNAU_1238 [Blattamonas nauphoetae]